MSYGIADLSIVPMRSEKSERSEMVSQILFGEVFEILEVDEKWVYVRMLHDRYEGWIDRKMYLEVTEEFIGKYKAEVSVLATEVFNIVVKDGDYGNKLVVSGSVFPFFDATTKKMQIGGDTYTLVSKMKDVGIDSLRDLIIGYALMYYNTPYLWGGRSPYGIDCSGLSQIVYRMAGIDLPRDASQQVTASDRIILSSKKRCPVTWLSSETRPERSLMSESFGNKTGSSMLPGGYGWTKSTIREFSTKT